MHKIAKLIIFAHGITYTGNYMQNYLILLFFSCFGKLVIIFFLLLLWFLYIRKFNDKYLHVALANITLYIRKCNDIYSHVALANTTLRSYYPILSYFLLHISTLSYAFVCCVFGTAIWKLASYNGITTIASFRKFSVS